MARQPSYYDILTAAVADMAEHGYDSAERLAYWQRRLREAAERLLPSASAMGETMRRSLLGIYEKLVGKGQVLKYHGGVSRFTLERLAPWMRAELDRRIIASADLIKLNREQSIEKTLRRFSGWSTSIPAGGARRVDRVKIKAEIRKPLAALPFEERRVAIDQGHKLISSINEIVAKDGGAIAARWRSHFRQAGYDYRPDHKERDGLVFAVRGNWALKGGLMVAGPNGYVDETERPAELPFCRCFYVYVYNLRDLPADMLTKKGVAELARVRALIAA